MQFPPIPSETAGKGKDNEYLSVANFFVLFYLSVFSLPLGSITS